ncbi:MAG: polysaccharide transporter, family [Solirubrobacteraceae bacterium]|nr:polysaccharide transporter, family [Solirubrobacteraceae bacterium]
MTAAPAAPPAGSLRRKAARGTLVNAAFDVVLQALGLLKGFVVAAFLARADYGLWGILVITLGTLSWLKQVGISEKFVQQDAPDQRLAFQQAFTLDLIANLVLMVVGIAVLPAFAAVYGQWDIVLPGLVLLAGVPFVSLRAPTWIFYRDMRYGRQRLLEAADPIASFVITIALAALGLGYWALVIGFVAGTLAAAAIAVAVTPYPLALRYDRRIAREYFAFSWPLFVASGSTVVIPQTSMLVGEAKLGLAGAGVITLASSISMYTDRVDQVLTQTLYPAICRVQDRTALLYEAFVKSNRLTLMWGVPFGAGIALFADDIVHFGLGDKWEPAIGLIRAFAITAAANHIGFNWSAFFRARGDTRPLAVAGPGVLLAFLVIPLPALILFGLDGYGVGVGAMTLMSLCLRTFYLRRLFPEFRLLRYAARALAPTLPAVAVVLVAKALVDDPTALHAAVEVVVYLAVTAAATLRLEGPLVREALGYLRG